MALDQYHDKSNQIMGNDFKTHLSTYQPKNPTTQDFKVLRQLTEYRDYKFSNGFYYLEKDELITMVMKMSVYNFEQLLDQLFGISFELYVLFKKILMNESTDENYVSYITKLEATGIMNYNWSCYYCS